MNHIETLKQWIEVLENCTPDHVGYAKLRRDALASMRQALAEQPKEPPKFDPNESFAREEAAQARVREFMRNH